MTHCESVSALQDMIQGHTYSLVIVDKAGEGLPLEVINQLGLSLRAPGVPLRMILAGNPGGTNHSALSERYVTARDPWAIFEFAGQSRGYAPSTADSNPRLPEAYQRNFEVLRTTDLALYKAHRHDDWSAITGDFFAGSWRADEMVIDHHDLPPHLFTSFKLAIDWGSAVPCVALLMGTLAYDVRLPDDRVMPKGSVVVYDEQRSSTRATSPAARAVHPRRLRPPFMPCAPAPVSARGASSTTPPKPRPPGVTRIVSATCSAPPGFASRPLARGRVCRASRR